MRQKLLIPILFLAPLTVMARTFDVKEYGAVSDTARLSTTAIQRAIDDCSNSGGGRVVVPTGDHKTGSLPHE